MDPSQKRSIYIPHGSVGMVYLPAFNLFDFYGELVGFIQSSHGSYGYYLQLILMESIRLVDMWTHAWMSQEVRIKG